MGWGVGGEGGGARRSDRGVVGGKQHFGSGLLLLISRDQWGKSGKGGELHLLQTDAPAFPSSPWAVGREKNKGTNYADRAQLPLPLSLSPSPSLSSLLRLEITSRRPS